MQPPLSTQIIQLILDKWGYMLIWPHKQLWAISFIASR